MAKKRFSPKQKKLLARHFAVLDGCWRSGVRAVAAGSGHDAENDLAEFLCRVRGNVGVERALDDILQSLEAGVGKGRFAGKSTTSAKAFLKEAAKNYMKDFIKSADTQRVQRVAESTSQDEENYQTLDMLALQGLSSSRHKGAVVVHADLQEQAIAWDKLENCAHTVAMALRMRPTEDSKAATATALWYNGWGQQELALRYGVNVATINRWIRNGGTAQLIAMVGDAYVTMGGEELDTLRQLLGAVGAELELAVELEQAC